MKIKRRLKKKINGNYCECGCGQEVRLENRFINGHSRFSKKHSEKTKSKMSKSHKGIIFSEEHKRNLSLSKKGKNHPMFGRKVSNKTKRKISKTLQNHKVLEKTRRKISLAMNSRIVSDETKLRMSIAKQNTSKECRKKLSLVATGRKHTNETKLKISISHMRCRTDGYCDVWSDINYRNDCRKDYCENIDCDKNSERLNLHHINLDPLDCRPINFITLCVACHMQLHQKLYYMNNRIKIKKEDFVILIKKDRIIYIHKETRQEVEIYLLK